MTRAIIGRAPPTNKCSRCGSWTIRGANFCHQCGCSLTETFEASAPALAGPGGMVHQTREIIHKNSRTLLAEGGLLTALAVGFTYAVANELPALAIGLTIPLSAYAIPKILPAVSGSIAELRTAFALSPKQSKSNNEVLRVEFTDELQRPRILQEFDERIGVQHLAHIGKRLGEGAAFSRPQMAEPGALSQVKFDLVKAEFLRLNFAIPKHPKAPNLGVVLTERGRRLVNRAYLDFGDD